jgi:hypothetical protein
MTEPARDGDNQATPATWLRDKQKSGTSTEAALEFFDSLRAATLEEMDGRWRGSGLHTGHKLDGLLEAFGWYGKEFSGPDFVYPLLFETGGGEVYAVNPKRIPYWVLIRLRGASFSCRRLWRGLLSLLRPLVGTQKPGARIRMLETRGKLSATMIYDFLPIQAVFRRVDNETLLGLLDPRDVAQPFFFVLRRPTS